MSGHVFDPFKGHCRPVFCGRGMQLTDGQCVHSNQQTSAVNQTIDCSLIRLTESEYDVVENDSILVTGLVSVVYRRGQYWIIDINDTQTVHICNPYTDNYYNLTLNTTRLVAMFNYDVIQSLLSLIGSVVSLSALAVQFLVYMLLPALRNTPGKCVICLVVSLFIGQLLYLCVGLHHGQGNI